MPEVVTKHPDVVKQVLESAGAKCGRGLPQKILTRCPRSQFCALPGGEICVFGIEGVPQMTQVTRAELCQASGESAPAPPRDVLGAGGGLLATAIAAVLVVRWTRR